MGFKKPLEAKYHSVSKSNLNLIVFVQHNGYRIMQFISLFICFNQIVNLNHTNKKFIYLYFFLTSGVKRKYQCFLTSSNRVLN
jgi:hypothetical protein